MNDLAISRGGPISDATCYFDYKDLDAAQRKGARDSQPDNARANYNGLMGHSVHAQPTPNQGTRGRATIRALVSPRATQVIFGTKRNNPIAAFKSATDPKRPWKCPIARPRRSRRRRLRSD